MRLIDADALIKSFEEEREYLINRGLLGAEDVICHHVLPLIDNAPMIDAVEVVMCKDCRHANECHKSVQYTRNEPNSVTIGFSPIEWCSRGERREE